MEATGSTVRLALQISAAAMERIRENEASPRILRWKVSDPEREKRQNVREIIEMMGLSSGSRVADIGAGLGFLTVRLAHAVGPEGRVYAVDIDKDALEELRRRVSDAPWPQAECILGSEDSPRLPTAALDAALIVNAYHEMTRHQEMLAAIFRALKPGGRLLIVEPLDRSLLSSSRSEQIEKHVIAPALVEQELLQAGFEIIARNDEFSEREGEERAESLVLAIRPTRFESLKPRNGNLEQNAAVERR